MNMVKSSSLLFVSMLLFGLQFVIGCEPEDIVKVKKKGGGPQYEYFAVYIATLDGKQVEEVIRDPRREMNHTRISNDLQWITFTRFNKFNNAGYAVEEESHYMNTEVMRCRINGSELSSIVPPRKGFINANSYWASDGKRIVYVSTDNIKKRPQLHVVNADSRKIDVIPVPEELYPTDPHMHGGLIVYPAKRLQLRKNRIWIMNINGSEARQLARADKNAGEEFDPKISPDKTKVAFMRYRGKIPREGVQIIVADIQTGTEKNLSVPGSRNIDAMPEWSSDGKLLVFWHLNWADFFGKSGIYTIRPDGTGRKKVPLPKGYSYTMPAFVPGTGSGDNAKIIYAARKFLNTPRSRQ
ncbi:MAG: TolB family protein [Planctomycetota bacterium]